MNGAIKMNKLTITRKKIEQKLKEKRIKNEDLILFPNFEYEDMNREEMSQKQK